VASSSASLLAPAADSPRPLRRDAERNRRLILDAARAAFASRGVHVTLDEIAHLAGVGVGTVYRRFPDKERLLEALFEERIAGVLSLAAEAAEDEDPGAGFARWFAGFVSLLAEDRGLKEALLSSGHGERLTAAAVERLLPLVARLLRRAQRAGELRGDLRAADVLLLGHMVASVSDTAGEVAPQLFRRYLAVVMDGLCVRRERPSRLPGAPPSDRQLEAIRHAHHR